MPESWSNLQSRTLPSGLAGVFRSLRYRNFRLFFIGQVISLIGTWMQRTALMWLVYRLTDSAEWLGLVTFTQFIPIFILGPAAGVAADRVNRQRLLLATQAAAMVQAGVLAWLTLAGRIEVWSLLGLSLVLGIINAFDVPVRQSLFIHMIEDRADLSNAIALNSAMFNGARLLGPAVSGFLIAWLGEGLCFLLNAASFVPVLAAVAALRLNLAPNRAGDGGVMRNFQEGLAYVAGHRPIRTILLLLALSSLTGPYMVQLPLLAKEVLGGGPHVYGLLMAAAGGGALLSAFYMAWRRTTARLGRLIGWASLAFTLGLTLLGLSSWLIPCLVLLLVIGFGLMTQISSANTFIQSVVDDAKRGRVMSLYSMALLGMVPFGNLMGGLLAGQVGVRLALIICGGACLVESVWYWSRLRRHPALGEPRPEEGDR